MNATNVVPAINNEPATRKSFRFWQLLLGVVIGLATALALPSFLHSKDQVVRQSQAVKDQVVGQIQAVVDYSRNYRLEYYRPNGAVTLYIDIDSALSQVVEAKRTRDVLEVALAEAGWIAYRPYSDVKVGDAFFKMKRAEYDPERNRFHLKVTIDSDGHREAYGEYRFNTMAPGLGSPVLDTAHATEEPLGYRDGGDITNRATLVLQVLEELREARSQQSLKRGKLY